jgi:hypothetical protein
MDRKVFVIKIFYSSDGSYVSVESQSRREFPVRDYQRETLPRVLLNILKKKEVCVMIMTMDVNKKLQILRKELCSTGDRRRRYMNKCATFSTIGLGLSQHCMKMLW